MLNYTTQIECSKNELEKIVQEYKLEKITEKNGFLYFKTTTNNIPSAIYSNLQLGSTVARYRIIDNILDTDIKLNR